MGLYGLPTKVIFCKKCVMSNQKVTPSIVTKDSRFSSKNTLYFDQDNICEPCRIQEESDNKIDWDQREKELIDLLNKYESNDGSHD